VFAYISELEHATTTTGIDLVRRLPASKNESGAYALLDSAKGRGGKGDWLGAVLAARFFLQLC
jgi:hypothetical protein